MTTSSYPTLTPEETEELSELASKYGRLTKKLANGKQLTADEDDWLQTRPHYISTLRAGIDIIGGELISLPAINGEERQ